MTLSCDAAYNLIETILIIVMSLLVVGLAAAFVIVGNYLIIRHLLDDLLGPQPPHPSDEERDPPPDFTPVDVKGWGSVLRGGEVNSREKLYEMDWHNGEWRDGAWPTEGGDDVEEAITLPNGDVW